MNRKRIDRHFRLQVLNTAIHHVENDVIGRMESFDADIEAIFKRIADAAEPGKLGIGERANWRRSSVSRNPNKVQIERIRQPYADDFEAFSYD